MARMTRDQQLIDTAIAAVKEELREDVRAGVIPADVPDFSTLHDYVDANMYGGEATDALYDAVPDHDSDEVSPYAGINAMQTAVDDWIKAGGLREVPAIACRHCGAHIIQRLRTQRWESSDGSNWCGDGMEQQHAPAEVPLTV